MKGFSGSMVGEAAGTEDEVKLGLEGDSGEAAIMRAINGVDTH